MNANMELSAQVRCITEEGSIPETFGHSSSPRPRVSTTLFRHPATLQETTQSTSHQITVSTTSSEGDVKVVGQDRTSHQSTTFYAKGVGRNCSVRGCNYNGKRLLEVGDRPCFDHYPQLRRDCNCDPPYRFYSPKSADQRQEWLSRLQLKNPPKNLYVCSFHFVDKKPTEQNPSPQLLLGHDSRPVFEVVVKRSSRSLIRSDGTEGQGVKRGKRKASSTTVPESEIPEKQFQGEASSSVALDHGKDKKFVCLQVFFVLFLFKI